MQGGHEFCRCLVSMFSTTKKDNPWTRKGSLASDDIIHSCEQFDVEFRFRRTSSVQAVKRSNLVLKTQKAKEHELRTLQMELNVTYPEIRDLNSLPTSKDDK